MSDLVKREPAATFVQLPGVGGFPVDNIAFWKMDREYTSEGYRPVLMIQFKTGGFINLPDTTEQEFASLVYGEPF